MLLFDNRKHIYMHSKSRLGLYKRVFCQIVWSDAKLFVTLKDPLPSGSTVYTPLVLVLVTLVLPPHLSTSAQFLGTVKTFDGIYKALIFITGVGRRNPDEHTHLFSWPTFVFRKSRHAPPSTIRKVMGGGGGEEFSSCTIFFCPHVVYEHVWTHEHAHNDSCIWCWKCKWNNGMRKGIFYTNGRCRVQW